MTADARAARRAATATIIRRAVVEGGLVDDVASTWRDAVLRTDEERNLVREALRRVEALLGRKPTLDELLDARLDLPVGPARGLLIEAGYLVASGRPDAWAVE